MEGIEGHLFAVLKVNFLTLQNKVFAFRMTFGHCQYLTLFTLASNWSKYLKFTYFLTIYLVNVGFKTKSTIKL